MDIEGTVLLVVGIKGEVRMVVLVRREGVVEGRGPLGEGLLEEMVENVGVLLGGRVR
jgi:hypothetical protein